MSTPFRDVRARAAHLYRHPEDATHDDIRALVVMSEALRECRQGDIRDRYVMLSVWQVDKGQYPKIMLSEPLADDQQIAELMAGLLREMKLKPVEKEP